MKPFSSTCRFLAAFAIIAALGVPAGVRAQATSNSAVASSRRIVTQDTVVVSASKIRFRLADLATSATVLPREQIRLGTARSPQDALAAAPGVHIIDQSGSETQGVVEARGFAAQGQSSHVLVLIDEMPVNDLEGDRIDWNLLGLDQVDGIELLRGPASFLYGDASMAGVINLVTPRPAAGLPVWAQAGGGSFGRATGGGGLAFGSERVNAGLSGSFQHLDGYRDHSAFDGGNGYGYLRTALSERWTMRSRLLGNRTEQEVPGPLPDPDWKDNPKRAGTPDDRRDATAWQGAAELAGPLATGLDVTALFSSDLRDLKATETIVPIGTLDRTSDSKSFRGETRLHWQPPRSRLPHLLLGGEVVKGSLESRYYNPGDTSPVGAGDVERLSGGVYALAQLRPHERITVTGGARMDWLRSSLDDPTDTQPRGNDDDLRAFSPTFGLNVALPSGGNAWATYAGSFKAPTLEQLYDRRPIFGSLISNNSLRPQRGHHGEIGVRSRLVDWASSDMTLYYIRSRDEIGFDISQFKHVNIDRSTHFGIETGLTAALPAQLTGQLAYAFTSATFDGGDHDGHQINTVPEHVAHGRLSWEHSLHGSVSTELTWVAKQWIDEDETYRLPDYAVVDIGARQSLGLVELFADVRNFFDKRYATLGYVSADVSTFPPADLPLYFPAAGRSFQAGLRVGPGRPVTEER